MGWSAGATPKCFTHVKLDTSYDCAPFVEPPELHLPAGQMVMQVMSASYMFQGSYRSKAQQTCRCSIHQWFSEAHGFVPQLQHPPLSLMCHCCWPCPPASQPYPPASLPFQLPACRRIHLDACMLGEQAEAGQEGALGLRTKCNSAFALQLQHHMHLLLVGSLDEYSRSGPMTDLLGSRAHFV